MAQGRAAAALVVEADPGALVKPADAIKQLRKMHAEAVQQCVDYEKTIERAINLYLLEYEKGADEPWARRGAEARRPARS